jgi:hypothetical protein
LGIRSPQSFQSLDEEFVYLARERIPGGFGGWFYDEHGRLTVWLVDPSQRDAALSALTPILTNRTPQIRASSLEAGIQFLYGEYDFVQLKEWQEQINSVAWTIPDIVSTAVDEGRNRVLVRVESATGEQDIERTLNELGIPRVAVITERGKRPQAAITLEDRTRPVRGGDRVSFFRNTTGTTASCTMSFNAVRVATGSQGFVTNSHCSDTQGGFDDEEYYQNTMSASNSVGREEFDTPFLAFPGCPTNYTCRYSDALFVKYHSPSPTGEPLFGRHIGQPYGPPDNYFGSKTINPNAPVFSIVGKSPYPLKGDTLHKVGIVTGWTYGRVVETCEWIPLGYWKGLLCQDRLDTGINSGDSGSPVFYLNGGSYANVVGVLWGGDTGAAYFSNMQNVERDLGTLNIY